MRLIFSFLVLFFLLGSASGQNPPMPTDEILSEIGRNESFYPKNVYIYNLEELKSYLIEHVDIWNATSIKLDNTVKSHLGVHYTFVQFLHGYPIEFTSIRAHVLSSGALVLVQACLIPEMDIISPIESRTATESSVGMWLPTIGGLQLCDRIVIDDEESHFIYTNNGKEVYRRGGKLHFQGPDSMVHAQVFLTNPLNSANVKYGAPYVDNNDADVPEINAQRKWVTMKAKYSNDTFYLENDRYRFEQLSDPWHQIIYATTDTFSFTRSDDNFEDVNAFFHITQYSDYIESIGFKAQLPPLLLIDAHAFNGADASGFTFNTDPTTLEFGEGGVDDAEDGEVVVHEFGHSISHFSSPNTVSGRERSAMEEGNADYLCKSYSNTLAASELNRSNIFSWDGHNEYWEGITTNVNTRYPTHLTGNTNDDRAMWSTPLFCILDKIGKEKTDSLVLTHFLFQNINTNMTEMARNMLLVDTFLWAGKHSKEIQNCFAANNILNADDPNKPPPVPPNIVVFNSLNFALGEGNLDILVPGSRIKQIVIFNELGQIMEKFDGFVNRILLKPANYPNGTFFIHVETGDYVEVVRIVRLQ
jgi:hypothetical protein